MKKLLNTLILCGLTSNGYCAVSSHTDIKEPKLTQNDIAKLPQTGEGVRIVPDSELYHVKLPKKQQIAFDNAKKLGYVKKKSYEAINLLHYEKAGFLSSDDQKYYDSTDPMDTHLKRLHTQIPLAFSYHPISFVAPKDTIGFGAAMTFKDGWTGITQIFKYKKIGICNYLKTSVALNGSAIRLSKERISFYING